MRPTGYVQQLGLICGLGLLLSGCLFRPTRVPTRLFILAPIPVPEHAPAGAPQSSVEVGFVKMPAYLLRDPLIVRKSANEIKCLEDALWAERLDQSFRQVLADNLSAMLGSNQGYTSASEPDRGMVRVSVEVKQFDVDTQGRGTLIAWWHLTAPGSDKPVKGGQTRLSRAGPSPRGNPQAIATTLSALTADFSQELAQAIHQSAATRP